MILAGDIGGTKTQLALYPDGGGARTPALQRRFPSHDFSSLEALALQFLDEAGNGRISRAVFGVAGVVTNNHCETTNLPWHVDGAEMSRALRGARVTLLNDLAATAQALDVLGAEDLDVL